MTSSDRWRRVEEICHAALERDAPARAEFLADACGADDDLRREVETLLARAQTADGFLAAPIGAVAAGVICTEARFATGARLGAYEIVGALGAGGLARRGGEAVARLLGVEPIIFPGNHGGFAANEWSPDNDPAAFAAKLREVLAED